MSGARSETYDETISDPGHERVERVLEDVVPSPEVTEVLQRPDSINFIYIRIHYSMQIHT